MSVREETWTSTSGAEPRARRDRTSRRLGPELALALSLFAALLAALLPLFELVTMGTWVGQAAWIVALVLAVGFVLRRLDVSAVLVSLAEIAAWAVATTVGFLGTTAWFAVIPTADSFALARELLEEAMGDILYGVAPMAPTPGISFLVVTSVGFLTIAVDHVAITARLPLLAAVPLLAVWVIGPTAAGRSISPWAFVLFAAAILLLLRSETRSREPQTQLGSATVTAVSATAIAAVSLLVALSVTPRLPDAVPIGLGAGGGGTIVDPSLSLGNDLRQPSPEVVLRMQTNLPTPPYLRMATLSAFDGETWDPDPRDTVPLRDDSFAPLSVDPEISVTQHESTIAIDNLSSRWVPLPYAPITVEGLGDGWGAMPENRTVSSTTQSTQDRDFAVTNEIVHPTLEQIRSRSAVVPAGTDDVDVLSVPEDTPDIVWESARRVTAGLSSDYDRLIAVQDWFRSAEFSYSLDAPVEDGFDDSNVAAIGRFLVVKSGYCVHYAATFTLMARTLGIPTRIAVGFAPGTFLEEDIVTGGTPASGGSVEVRSDQLHAWPEVYFEGIGWVGFEPTNSLGVPTNFVSETETPDETEEQATPTPTPTAATATPTATPTSSATAAPTASAPDTTSPDTAFNLFPLLGGIAGVVLVLALPAIIAAIRRSVLLERARRGDVGAAWRVLQNLEIDLGGTVSLADSARVFAERLVRKRGAPAAQTMRIVRAIEHANYAASAATPGGGRDQDSGEDFARDVRTITSAVRGAAEPSRRNAATWLPRSLIVRPGSSVATADTDDASQAKTATDGDSSANSPGRG